MCGQSFWEDTEKNPNNHPEESVKPIPEKTVAVTCTTDGVNAYYCSACDTEYTETIECVGRHTYDGEPDYTPAVTATLELCGTLTKTCTVCGESDTQEVGHDWTAWKEVARQDGGIIYFRQCKRDECGFREEFISKEEGNAPCDEHEWNDGEVLEGDEPTIDKEGKKTFTCIVCGQTKTEKIPKLEPEEPVAPAYTVTANITKSLVTLSWELTAGTPARGDLRVEYYMLAEGTSFLYMDTELREDGGSLRIPMNGAIAFTVTLYNAASGDEIDSFTEWFI